MAWGVDQIEDVLRSIGRGVGDPDRLGFDGDTTFLFQFHPIQVLGFFVAVRNEARRFHNPVGQRGLSMIDMRYYAKITYVFNFGHADMCGTSRLPGKK